MPASDTQESGAWYWCLSHGRVEDSDNACRGDDRLGPYESAEAASQWKERSTARNEKWDKEDKEWSGD